MPHDRCAEVNCASSGPRCWGEMAVALTSRSATALPWFLALSTAISLGLMETAIADTREHLKGTRLEHLDCSLAEMVLPRRALALMRISRISFAASLARRYLRSRRCARMQ